MDAPEVDQRAAPSTPLRVDVIVAGSHGDVHPFVGVAAELARRGHRVRVFAHPAFRAVIETAGLELVPMGGEVDYEKLLQDPDLFHPIKCGPAVLSYLLDGVRRARPVLRAEFAAQRPHVVLMHHICLGARWVCEEFELPNAVGHLTPALWFSRRDPVPAFQPLPGALARMLSRLVLPLMDWFVTRHVDRRLAGLRREFGLPPERDSFRRDSYDGAVTLALWSASFRAAQSDDPPRSTICGFVFHDRVESEPPSRELERFLASGPPPVVFSLGTAASHQPGDFFELARDACTELGVRGVLVTAGSRGLPKQLPTHVLGTGYVPFSTLLPRAAAFVHHGGIGTLAQGLRAGVAMLVVAHAHDQFNNGVRVVKLGAGRMLARPWLTRRRLVAALGRMLAEPSYPDAAARIAEGIRHENGAAEAASAVERTALIRR